MSIVVAAELSPSRCAIAAVRHDPDGSVNVVAALSIPSDARLSERLRAFRRDWQLPLQLRLVLWPRIGDSGVMPLTSAQAAAVRLPGLGVIRERARPVVRAGFRIVSVDLPHVVMATLAASLPGTSAVGLAIERQFGCVMRVEQDVVSSSAYVSWPAQADADGETLSALPRYQFGALLAPRIQALLSESGTGAEQLFACGGIPDLRLRMVPFIEELDREIDVLDGEFLGGVGVTGDRSDTASSAGFQIAVAAAAK